MRLQSAARSAHAEPSIDERKGVQSVDRAFEILAVLEAATAPMGVAEIASTLDSSPSKIHHYLVSLIRCGVLRQTARGKYDLGPGALSLGLSALSRLDTVERTSEAAEALRDQLGEAVFVAVWGNRGPTIIRYFEGFRPLTVEARAGLVLPVLTSATGRVFLAWGNAAQVEPLAESEASSDIERTRAATLEAGLGFVDGDLLPRIASLAGPVFSYNSDLSLAITVLGWSGDFDHDPSGPVGTALRKTCEGLSVEFGGGR
ncbi:MAG: IclR family transcriptional regulator [Pseudomonadota bacterium]